MASQLRPMHLHHPIRQPGPASGLAGLVMEHTNGSLSSHREADRVLWVGDPVHRDVGLLDVVEVWVEPTALDPIRHDSSEEDR